MSATGQRSTGSSVSGRLTILTTHPIQYQVPVWQEMARRDDIPFEVWYLSHHGARHALDRDFARSFAWDLDMLQGYPYRFLPTHPAEPDLTSFRGARIGPLKRLFRESGSRVLWIQGWQVQAYWQAILQAHGAGIPIWLRGETNDLRRSRGLWEAPRSAAVWLMFRWISRFFYIGTANCRMYRRFGVPDHKLVPAPYCVDNARFRESAAACRSLRPQLRERWSIPPGAVCFLFCGKLIAKKRPLDLVEALDIVVRHNRSLVESLHLLVVGDGRLAPEMRRQADELAHRHGRQMVTFAGFLNQSEIPQAYAAADCLILPSDSGETWGLVVNEALASGIPAIVSDQCGCAEDLVAPLDRRLVFPCGQTEALARIIEQAVTGRLLLPDTSCCQAAVATHDIGRTVDSVTREWRKLADD